jgi:cobalt-zinc-cadmium efflux system outer membrane protein
MRRAMILLLLTMGGCAHREVVPLLIETQVAGIAPVKVTPTLPLTCASPHTWQGPVNLDTLWELTLANNPSLREAAAQVEQARGKRIQAGKYPNPRAIYHSEEVFSSIDGGGIQVVEFSQEILTGGKFRLDKAIATRQLDAATVGLLGRKFDVLTRLRRAYNDYLALAAVLRAHDQAVKSVQQNEARVREVVKAGLRPSTDLLRMGALLNDAVGARERARISLEAAWRLVANEVGLPDLPPPAQVESLPDIVPHWQREEIRLRVQSGHTELRQAQLMADRARLAAERARAEAIPNVSIGAGYSRGFVEETAGAVFSMETTIPIWDRKQGQRHEAQAAWAQAQANQRTVALRLNQETTDAFSRYTRARQQVEQISTGVIPPLEKALREVEKGYGGLRATETFGDVQLTVESLNDARLRLAQARRELWQAVADLQGLMQLDLGEELSQASCPHP